ncbi:uncharacterized protein LOC141525319 [Cotesia typhae]|uniref:uncharacterized protein LOC141525319 n=1 Tax=Cotesia typhae TaxID=2053667 RepID=UPI003D684A3B
MSSSKVSCCIRGCSNMPYKNKNQNTSVKFYRFPASTLNSAWITLKRQQWINAVKNYVKYPNDWEPTQNTRICSAHFVNNQKSEHPRHPSYIPTIFPGRSTFSSSAASTVLSQSLLGSEFWRVRGKENHLYISKSVHGKQQIKMTPL